VYERLIELCNAWQIILLGDSAVGKSKLMERFLLDDYVSQQVSTYALTLYRFNTLHPKSAPGEARKLSIDFWDTGTFNSRVLGPYFKS
jgi:Rab-like protein 2